MMVAVVGATAKEMTSRLRLKAPRFLQTTKPRSSSSASIREAVRLTCPSDELVKPRRQLGATRVHRSDIAATLQERLLAKP
jgi:hypothetical protein